MKSYVEVLSDEGVVVSDEEGYLDISPLKNMKAVGRVGTPSISNNNLNSTDAANRKRKRAQSLAKNMQSYEKMRKNQTDNFVNSRRSSFIQNRRLKV